MFQKIDPALRYVGAIRSGVKREYALAYLTWLRVDRVLSEPSHAGLTAMAAQAVRMTLHDLERRED